MDQSLTHHGILGMKWGVRRYQNKDGTLTAAGEKRYNGDVRRNNQKKRKDRVSEDALRDPNRWVREDLEKKQQVVNTSSGFVRQLQSIEKSTRPKSARMDLSDMTDQELRQRINRELIERQYSDLFNTNQSAMSKGREYLVNTLEIAGGVLAVGSSALSIALAIRQLKN